VGREARDSLAVFDMDILDSELCQRVAYIDAMTSGVSVMQYAPSSKAADEVESLCDEITLPQAQSEPRIQEEHQYTQSQDVEDQKPEPYLYTQPQDVEDENPESHPQMQPHDTDDEKPIW
jgi:hypothetical protein